jgi:hypothetical protein
MDNEMIERVAKAILETPNASDYKTLVAKNAIKAMREPTKRMCNKGYAVRPIEVCWRTMIDAIIGDK